MTLILKEEGYAFTEVIMGSTFCGVYRSVYAVAVFEDRFDLPVVPCYLFRFCRLLSMNSSDVEGSICANQSTGPQLVQIPGLYLVLVINVTHIIPTEGSSLQ